jgi:hypothetical protein
MNDNHLPRTDVLDDDGAPQDATRKNRTPPSNVTDSKEHGTASPIQAPARDNPDKAAPQPALQSILRKT